MPPPRSNVLVRAVLCVLAAAAAPPVAAYVPPASAILRRVVQHRDELKLTSLSVHGTVTLAGAAAEAARSATGIAPEAPTPALLLVKVPGRCRLELASQGTPAAQRPAITVRTGRVVGTRGLADVPAARALVEAVCTLLADRASAGDPERAVSQRLTDRGVDLREVSFGRYQGRVVWILGGRQGDDRPTAWIDKQTFEPVRLLAPVGGATRDVRFAAPAERFPRSVEVWSAGQLEARFSAGEVTSNPRLPDALFP